MKKFLFLLVAMAILAFSLAACSPAKSAGVDTDYVSSLVQAILVAVLPVLAAQAVAYLFAAFQAKRAELSERQRYLLDQGIEIAVFAAQQLYKAGEGAKKKEYALKVAESWVKNHGLKLDLVTLEAQIEAAVYDQLSHKSPPVVGGSEQG